MSAKNADAPGHLDCRHAPDFEVRGWVSSYQAIRDGSLEAVSPHVREFTGREPVTLAQYLQAHPEALDHVTGKRP